MPGQGSRPRSAGQKCGLRRSATVPAQIGAAVKPSDATDRVRRGSGGNLRGSIKDPNGTLGRAALPTRSPSPRRRPKALTLSAPVATIAVASCPSTPAAPANANAAEGHAANPSRRPPRATAWGRPARISDARRNPFMDFEPEEVRLKRERNRLQEDSTYMRERKEDLRRGALRKKHDADATTSQIMYENRIEFGNYSTHLRKLKAAKHGGTCLGCADLFPSKDFRSKAGAGGASRPASAAATQGIRDLQEKVKESLTGFGFPELCGEKVPRDEDSFKALLRANRADGGHFAKQRPGWLQGLSSPMHHRDEHPLLHTDEGYADAAGDTNERPVVIQRSVTAPA